MVYSLTPEQFTIGFSVIDRNESALSQDELEKIIGFYFLAADESSSTGEPTYTPIPAVECFDLYKAG